MNVEHYKKLLDKYQEEYEAAEEKARTAFGLAKDGNHAEATQHWHEASVGYSLAGLGLFACVDVLLETLEAKEDG